MCYFMTSVNYKYIRPTATKMTVEIGFGQDGILPCSFAFVGAVVHILELFSDNALIIHFLDTMWFFES